MVIEVLSSEPKIEGVSGVVPPKAWSAPPPGVGHGVGAACEDCTYSYWSMNGEVSLAVSRRLRY